MTVAIAWLALLILSAPQAVLALPLSGTYTVGGEAPHFATLQDATAALTAEGVSGPVVFDIRTGTYDGPVNVIDIAGASADNTITFQSETGSADDVVVAGDTMSVWQVSGDWITLQHLTLRQEALSEVYARVLEITGDVNHVQVLHNRLVGTTAQTTIYDRFAVLFNWKTSTYAADDILIEGNEILNGSVGIYWGGSSLFEGSGLRIRNNTVRDWGMRGIQLLTEPGAEVVGNEISTSSTYSSFPYALLLESCNDAVRIDKNQISTTHYIGIGVRDGFGSAPAPALITNNFVRVGYPTTIGLNLHESEYQEVLHNTVIASGNFGSSVAMNVYYGSHNVLLNNVFEIDAEGSALKVTFADTSVDVSNFNLLHAESGFVGITGTFDQYATLADWQVGTGLDLDSVEGPAIFVAPDDLHLAAISPGIDNAQSGIVADDIDYALRPLEADIGADEQGHSACAFLAAVSPADCPVDNGAIDLTAVAGDPPFVFAWSDGADTEDRLDLAPDSYSVTVTNDFGCNWSETFVVDCAPGDPVLEIVVENEVDATCTGECNGVVEVGALGGVPPYSFSMRTRDSGWRPSTGYEDALCAGQYRFRVRDAEGNTESINVTVSEPQKLRSISISRENVSCKGESDASFEVGAKGGVPPYRFSNNGGVTWQDGGYFDGLAAGIYPVRTEDANACFLTRDLTISEPAELLLSVVAVQNESFPGAADGSIEISSSGGTGDHEYSIDGGNSWQSTPLFGGLSANTYTILVQDEKSCLKSVMATVG